MSIEEMTRDWGQQLRLSMPEPLETAYREHQRRHAVEVFRINVVFIFLLWLLVSSGIYALMPAGDLPQWSRLYGSVGVVILAAACLSWVRVLDHWFHLYIGVGSFVAVALSVAITGVLRDPVPGQLTQTAINYCMVIIYGLVGLRFTQALAAGWLGGAAGVVMALVLGGNFNWDLYLVSFAGSSFLGMCLAYYSEHRSRAMFILQLSRIDKLEHLSSVDSLTGLANRRHLDKTVLHEWRRAYRQQLPLAVMMIDIDRFKRYNDHYGHIKGDACLRVVANVIARYARRPGDMAARYGGEEFVLLLPDMDMNEASVHAERLLADIRAANLVHAPNAGRAVVSISIGLAVAVPFANWEPDWLLESADRAMYEAKHDGGDCYRFGVLRLSQQEVANSDSH
jgi:diguanylate cyclase (GGDEF)-like protein